MTLIKTTLALALGAASFAAFANHHESGDDMFKMMDTDSDGRVSGAEHTVAADKMFQKMDTNNDGNVTAAEMDAAHTAMKGEKMDGKMADDKMDHAKMDDKMEMTSAEKIKEIDKDGDGMVSKMEHADGSKMMFDKMDTDRDGSMTAAEMKMGHEKMMSKKAM